MPISLKSALVLVGALALVGAACSSDAQGAPPARTSMAGEFTCPITKPGQPYVATAPNPPQPPDTYGSVWYGSDKLWTMLSRGGEAWHGLPRQGTIFTQKTFWWSQRFDIAAESQPLISVNGTRLDAPGSFVAGNPGTNAYADFGTAMLVGIDLPSAGCWEIRARYKGAELAYVVRVEE